MSDPRYTEPFFATPYSLYHHHLWITATNDEKEVLRVLQFRSAVHDMPYNNNGLAIRLQRGQACMSYTQMALEANTTVKKARGAVNHFRGYERSGKKLLQLPSQVAPILRAQQKAQLGAQQKTIVDILLDGYFVDEGTAKGTAKGSVEGTARAQRGHTNEEAKKTKEVISGSKEPSTTMAASPPPPIDSSISKETVREALIAKGIVKIRDQDQLFKSWGAPKTWLGLQHIFSDTFTINTTPIQALNDVCKYESWNNPKARKVSPKEIVEAYFEDGKIYQGYTCGMDTKGIWFYAGSISVFGGSYEDKPFVANFGKFCESKGIENPFKKTYNIKEA